MGICDRGANVTSRKRKDRGDVSESLAESIAKWEEYEFIINAAVTEVKNDNYLGDNGDEYLQGFPMDDLFEVEEYMRLLNNNPPGNTESVLGCVYDGDQLGHSESEPNYFGDNGDEYLQGFPMDDLFDVEEHMRLLNNNPQGNTESVLGCVYDGDQLGHSEPNYFGDNGDEYLQGFSMDDLFDVEEHMRLLNDNTSGNTESLPGFVYDGDQLVHLSSLVDEIFDAKELMELLDNNPLAT